MLKYHFIASEPEKNHLELRFCIPGRMYCRQYNETCRRSKTHASINCNEMTGSVDILRFIFSSSLLWQFVKSCICSGNIADRLLSFTHRAPISRTLPVCSKTRLVLDSLLNHSYTDTQENIFVNAQTQMLLLYGRDYLLGEKEIDTVTCNTSFTQVKRYSQSRNSMRSKRLYTVQFN